MIYVFILLLTIVMSLGSAFILIMHLDKPPRLVISQSQTHLDKLIETYIQSDPLDPTQTIAFLHQVNELDNPFGTYVKPRTPPPPSSPPSPYGDLMKFYSWPIK